MSRVWRRAKLRSQVTYLYHHRHLVRLVRVAWFVDVTAPSLSSRTLCVSRMKAIHCNFNLSNDPRLHLVCASRTFCRVHKLRVCAHAACGPCLAAGCSLFLFVGALACSLTCPCTHTHAMQAQIGTIMPKVIPAVDPPVPNVTSTPVTAFSLEEGVEDVEAVNPPSAKGSTKRFGVKSVIKKDMTDNGRLDTSAADLFNEADKDKDGNINMAEFEQLHQGIKEAAVIQERERATAVKARKFTMKVAKVITLLFCMSLLGNAGMTGLIVYLSEPFKVQDGKLQDKAGHTVKVTSADMVILDGVMKVPETSEPVKTAQSMERLKVDSRLDDEVWKEIKYLYFKSESGGMLNLLVQATSRTSEPPAALAYVRAWPALNSLQAACQHSPLMLACPLLSPSPLVIVCDVLAGDPSL